jgi:UDP-galactopyranose mutase
MPFASDFLVVGSGLTGATIARMLSDAGHEVLVLERRSHLGGNVHDYLHPSGVRIHTYGPHYFRTNSDELWQFVNRFAEFFEYRAVVKTSVNGRLENWPIAADYVRRELGENWRPAFRGTPANFQEACLAIMPRLVYERFVKGYTEKQWGTSAELLSAKLASRFGVDRDNDPHLSKHKYQGIPRCGYAEFTSKLMSGIPVVLNCDYIRVRDSFRARKLLIFTGAIDEFFYHDLGRLTYRAQCRRHEFLPTERYAQPFGQVNNPNPCDGTHVRTLEWKHMMPPEQRATITGTVVTAEHPYTTQNSDHYEYPFPDERNSVLYQAYRSRAAQLKNVLICGRLGEYRYFDMDQAIGRAMRLARKILNSSALSPAGGVLRAPTFADFPPLTGEPVSEIAC